MLLNFVRGCSVILLFLLLGNSNSSPPLAAKAAQYPAEAHATKSVVVVRVVWMEPAEVNVFCNDGEASEDYVILGCFDPSTNTIYTPQPRSFNDRQRLTILGHEFWHALGADHP